MRYFYLYSSIFLGLAATAQDYDISPDNTAKTHIYFTDVNAEVQHIFYKNIPEGSHNIILKDQYTQKPYQLFFSDYDNVKVENIREQWETKSYKNKEFNFESFVEANLGKNVRVIPRNMTEKESSEAQSYEARLIAKDIIEGPYGVELNVAKERILFSHIPEETTIKTQNLTGKAHAIQVSSPISSFFTLTSYDLSTSTKFSKGLYQNIYYDSFFDGKNFVIYPMMTVINKTDFNLKNTDLYYFWPASQYEGEMQQSMIISNAKTKYFVSEKSVTYQKDAYDIPSGFPYVIAKDVRIDQSEALTLPFSKPVILETDVSYSFTHRNYGRERFLDSGEPVMNHKYSSEKEDSKQNLPYHQYLSTAHLKWTYKGHIPLPAGLLKNNFYNQEGILVDSFNLNIPNLWPNQPYEAFVKSYGVRVTHQQVSWKADKKNSEFSNAKGEGEFVVRIINDNDHKISFELKELKEKADHLLSSSLKPKEESDEEFSWSVEVKPHSVYEIQYRLKFN